MTRVRRRQGGPGLSGLAAVFFFAACLAGQAGGPGEPPEPPSSGELPPIPSPDLADRPTYPVVRVPTGHTVVIRFGNGEDTLRLIGVYVPPEGAEAAAARAFAERLLAGERVYAVSEPEWPERDREGRCWAYVYRAPDGLNVNLELIRQGYGRVVAADAFAQQELYRAYEQHARRAGKGVWAPQGISEAAVTTHPATTRPTREADRVPRTADDSVLVYVTEHGTRYHTRDCRFVRGKGAAIPLRQARERGLKPCSRCRPPE